MTRFFLLILMFFPFLWISCSDEQFDIGRDDIDVKSNISYIDTFTVNSYTVIMDSVKTSNLSDPAVTVGRFDDPAFGIITAGSFFTVTLPSRVTSGSNPNKYGIPDEAVFDSIQLYIIYNKYYEGDTTVPFTIDVHRLKQKIKPGTDGLFYNTDSVPAMTDLLGQKTFIPSPHSGDTVWITLDPSFGNELFGYMKENDIRATDEDYFADYFNGFMLRHNENDRSILGFHYPYGASNTHNPVMRVHYHYMDLNEVKKAFDFKADYMLQFNKFGLHNQKVSFPANQRQKLPSSLTGNQSYVHAGIGIVTRLEIPYLKNLFYVGNGIQLLNAELVVEPARNTYTEQNLPPLISLFASDDQNRWNYMIYNKSGKPSLPKLFIDMLYQEETQYSFEITNFIQTELEKESDEIPALLMTVSEEDFNKTGRRVIFGSQHNKFNKVKLKLYYMTIE